MVNFTVNSVKDKIANNISAKVLVILNFIAAALILLVVVLRLLKIMEEHNPFYYTLTLYLVLADVLLVLAELQRVNVHKYVRFLSSFRGRSFFILFIGILVLEKDAAMIIIPIVLLIIAILGIVFGGRAQN